MFRYQYFFEFGKYKWSNFPLNEDEYIESQQWMRYIPSLVKFEHFNKLVAFKSNDSIRKKYPNFGYYATIKNTDKIYPFNIPGNIKNYNFIRNHNDSLIVKIAFSNSKDDYQVWLQMINLKAPLNKDRVISMASKCSNEKEQKLIIEIFKTVKFKYP